MCIRDRNATLSNRSKFVHLLLALMNRHGCTATDGSRFMELPLSRRDLASMIGTRHETLSRIIGRLEEDGLARFSGRTVHLTQPHSLVQEIQRPSRPVSYTHLDVYKRQVEHFIGAQIPIP